MFDRDRHYKKGISEAWLFGIWFFGILTSNIKGHLQFSRKPNFRSGTMIWERSSLPSQACHAGSQWEKNTFSLLSKYLEEAKKMGKTDFTDIRLQHITWRAKLDKFLKGEQSMTEEEATSPKACEVGKWLYSVGLEKYGVMEEIQELEKIHIELHATVRKIMSLKQSGNSHAETETLDKLDKILRKIMFLLVDIEEKLVLSGK